MMRVTIASQVAAAGLLACIAAGSSAQAATVLAPHRAIYDLKLVKSQGKTARSRQCADAFCTILLAAPATAMR